MTINIGTISKLTDNTIQDYLPAVIDSDSVAFGQVSGGNRSVAIYNAGATTFVDTNANNFFPPAQTIEADDSGEVIWTRRFGFLDNDIYRWNGSTVLRVDFTAGDATRPSIGRVGTYVYQLGANTVDITDSSGMRTITGNSPDADGNQVVYLNGGQVHVHNITSNSDRTITSSGNAKRNPQISGDLIVWEEDSGSGANPSEIMLADLTEATPTPQRITNNMNTDRLPDIYNNVVVWERNDAGTWNIIAYDASDASMQVVTGATATSARSPSVGNGGIAWVQNDGDDEIYFAPYTTPPLCDPLTGISQFNGRQLAGLYKTWFGRVPDAPGWDFWKNDFITGASTIAQISELMSQSPEANAIYDYLPGKVISDPATAQADMVNDFYQNMFDRIPDPAGFNFWLNELQTAGTPEYSDTLALNMVNGALNAGIATDIAAIDANIALIPCV